YINRLYTDLDKYVEQTTKGNQTNNQQNTQLNDGKTTTDNRSAFADLPQSSTNLNVDDDVMKHATDNTISKNKQTNQQTNENNTKGNTTNDNKTYQLDELFKSSGLLEQIFDTFDVKCFLQIW
ncbi:MAG: hypothetical protein L0K90_05535, partial [Staphylococcus equorum]|nr:hypothetical protein [Staphylococcus equorum]